MTDFQHFEEILRCDHSPVTVESYLLAVRKYLDYGQTIHTSSNEESIRRYLLSLTGKAARSINLYRAAILKFYRINNVAINIAEIPKSKEPKSLPRVLAPDDISKAIKKCKNKKHRLIISLFYGCGLRASELRMLKSENIIRRDEKLHYLKLNSTKGLRHRIVPIPKSIRPLLYGYAEGKDYLFRDISGEAIRKAVERAFAAVGVKANRHALRHSFATDQLLNGQDIKKVKEWLGHADLRTTEVYLHLNEEHLNSASDLLEDDAEELL